MLVKRKMEAEYFLTQLLNLTHPSAELLSDKMRIDLFCEYTRELNEVLRPRLKI